MAHRFFIGDKVKTQYGVGHVRRVTTWRDRIVQMGDAEAQEFCANCKLQVGLGFREDWVELVVAAGKYLRVLQASKVELLEGRDYGTEKAFIGRGPEREDPVTI